MDSNKTSDAHNKSSKAKHLSAADMVAFKLSQERKFKATLTSHFKQVGAQVKKSYNATGKLPSFKVHKNAVSLLISDHYIKTATKTSTTLRDNFKSVKNNTKLQALIDAKIETDAATRSIFASDSIVDTTVDNFKSYIKQAIVNKTIKENKFFIRELETKATTLNIGDAEETIGDDIQKMFLEELAARIDLISQMETGIAGDDGKSDEMDALEDTEAEFDDDTTISDYKRTKTWIAILDDRTRDEHAEADGQEVDYDEPYEVGGEQLMKPRNDDLGASDWNTMGCRCESVDSLE